MRLLIINLVFDYKLLVDSYISWDIISVMFKKGSLLMDINNLIYVFSLVGIDK